MTQTIIMENLCNILNYLCIDYWQIGYPTPLMLIGRICNNSSLQNTFQIFHLQSQLTLLRWRITYLCVLILTLGIGIPNRELEGISFGRDHVNL